MAVQVVHREELVRATIVYICDAESKEEAVAQLEAFDQNGGHPSVRRHAFGEVDLESAPQGVEKKEAWLVNGTPVKKSA